MNIDDEDAVRAIVESAFQSLRVELRVLGSSHRGRPRLVAEIHHDGAVIASDFVELSELAAYLQGGSGEAG